MANKFQHTDFHSVEDCLDFIPTEERAMAQILREIIIDNIPDCKEKLAYNVPFYYRHARICFIWPGSVPWGISFPGRVNMGICRGNLLGPALEYFQLENRKEVAMRNFYSEKDIDLEQIRIVLTEAVLLDEEIFRNKAKK